MVINKISGKLGYFGDTPYNYVVRFWPFCNMVAVAENGRIRPGS